MTRAIAGALFLVLSCAPAQPPERPVASERAHQALGEPTDGFPSWLERGIYYQVNRARADPQADLQNCSGCGEKTCYHPRAPLGWSHQLSRSARFHSANLGSCSAFEHESPCTLVADIGTRFTPGPCDGSAACACEGGKCGCQGGNCTDTWGRIGHFGFGRGENIASGGDDPRFVFYLWLHENASDPNCGFSLSNGHRWNILSQDGHIGVGCSGSICTQDFGGPGALGKVTVGTHYPSSGTVDFMAHWYDTAPPASALVNVGGTCQALTQERGVTGANSTWVLSSQSIPSCTRYYFVFTDSAGGTVRFPETGSYGVGCATDWESSAPPMGNGCGPCVPSCAGRTCGDDGCGGSCAPGCAPAQLCQAHQCVSGAGGGTATGGGTASGGGVATGGGEAVGGGSAAGGGVGNTGGGVSTGGNSGAGGASPSRSDAGTTDQPGSIHVFGACGCDSSGGLGALVVLASWLQRRRFARPG